jgi:hypothetical protein
LPGAFELSRLRDLHPSAGAGMTPSCVLLCHVPPL